MIKQQHELIIKPSNNPALTLIRAVATLAVVMIHAAGGRSLI